MQQQPPASPRADSTTYNNPTPGFYTLGNDLVTSPITPHFLTELSPPDAETNIIPGTDPHKYSPLLMTKGHVVQWGKDDLFSKSGRSVKCPHGANGDPLPPATCKEQFQTDTDCGSFKRNRQQPPGSWVSKTRL